MTSFFKLFSRNQNSDDDSASVFSDVTSKISYDGPNTLVIFDGKSETIQRFLPDSDEWHTVENGFTKEMKRWGFTTAVVHQDIFIFMNNRAVYRLQKSDTQACWSRMSDMRIHHGQYPPVTVLNGDVYAVGAAGVGTQTDLCERYDVLNNKWTQVRAMEVKRRNHSLVSANGNIYSIGGLTRTGVSFTMEKYVPDKDLWSGEARLKEGRYSAAAVAVGDTIYVMGGFASGKRRNDVIGYNTLTSQWTSIANMNISRMSFTACIIDGKIFAVGGDNGMNDTIEVLDSEKNAWEFLDILCTMRINAAVSFSS